MVVDLVPSNLYRNLADIPTNLLQLFSDFGSRDLGQSEGRFWMDLEWYRRVGLKLLFM